MTVQELIDKLSVCPFKDAVVAIQHKDSESYPLNSVVYYEDSIYGVFLTDNAE